MKLTAKQRAKIYRKIADEFERTQEWHGVCVQLKGALKEFPEFELFRPDENEGLSLWWSSTDDYNRNTRITALLLSEQIALNP